MSEIPSQPASPENSDSDAIGQLRTPPPRAQDELLIRHWGRLAKPQEIKRCLCVSTGYGQAALHLAKQMPECEVILWYLDAFRADLAARALGELPTNLQIHCAADAPEGQWDAGLLAISRNGEAELARDLMQAMFIGLTLGSELLIAVDFPEDKWVGEQCGALSKNISRVTTENAAGYIVRKKTELKKIRDFGCWFAVRDQAAEHDRLLSVCTRPGVFSHRHIDPGARQLMNFMEVKPNTRILDLGCGSGVVALAASAREPSATVYAIDSHTRAIQCTMQSIQDNTLSNVHAILSADGPPSALGDFDLVLANPPYYAKLGIAEFFLEAGRRSLRSGGKIMIVHKQPQWYDDNMKRWFSDVQQFESKNYVIAEGIKH